MRPDDREDDDEDDKDDEDGQNGKGYTRQCHDFIDATALESNKIFWIDEQNCGSMPT